MEQPTVDRRALVALAILSVLIAAPGVHLFELWLARGPAVWISHGIALTGLALTTWRWRTSRPS